MAPETQNISEVTEKIGLSPRRFIDLFRNEIGLTPKAILPRSPVSRKFCAKFPASQRQSIGSISPSKCGYFDQAHFIHDFRAFSGINPSAYTADYLGHVNHVPIKPTSMRG